MLKINPYCSVCRLKEFPCWCGRAYAQYASLWRHQKFECNKERQFVCEICGKKFTQQGSRKAHMVHLHGIFEKSRGKE